MSTEGVSLIKSLIESKGSKSKVAIIESNKHNKEFMTLLFYALNPLMTYKVSEKTLKENEASGNYDGSLGDDIFSLCTNLSECKALNNSTIDNIKRFLNQFDEDTRDIYSKIITKDLKLGVTGKTVNKVVSGFIPEWEVQQAYTLEKYPFANGNKFAVTQKLNGVRATYYHGELYARSGEIYSGLEHITGLLRLSVGTEIVLDGELTLGSKGALSDNEAFRKATGIINSDSDKTMISYTVFDALPASEFEIGESSDGYFARREALEKYSKGFDGKYVKLLPIMYSGEDQNVIPPLLDKMVREDKEGLMINLDCPYKCKRHRGILKVKRFYTMDLRIVGFEEGSGKLSGTLGCIVVDFKGNKVRVGSGLSDEQRLSLWNERECVIGKLCEVKYKEISFDKRTGAESLQFPVFVGIRSDKDEESFF